MVRSYATQLITLKRYVIGAYGESVKRFLRTVGEVGPSHDSLIRISAIKSPLEIDHDSSD